MLRTEKVIFLGYLTELCVQYLESKKYELLSVGLELDNPRSVKAKKFCLQNKIKFFDASDINNNKEFLKFAELKPLVSIGAFSQKISHRTLDTFRKNFFNFHPSLLPSYRGGSPIERQILNAEPTGGITFHWIDENFDSGEIIVQKKYSIGSSETYEKVLSNLVTLGSDALSDMLEISSSSWARAKMNESENSYYPPLMQRDYLVTDDTDVQYLWRLLRAVGGRGWVKIRLLEKELTVSGMVYGGEEFYFLESKYQDEDWRCERIQLPNVTLIV